MISMARVRSLHVVVISSVVLFTAKLPECAKKVTMETKEYRLFGPKGLVGFDACSMAAYTEDCLSKLSVLGDFPVKSSYFLCPEKVTKVVLIFCLLKKFFFFFTQVNLLSVKSKTHFTVRKVF